MSKAPRPRFIRPIVPFRLRAGLFAVAAVSVAGGCAPKKAEWQPPPSTAFPDAGPWDADRPPEPPKTARSAPVWEPVPAGDAQADQAKADALVLRAAEFNARGKRAEAIARLVEATNLSPKDAGIRGALARLLAEDGQKLRALDEFKRAHASDPGHQDSAFGLAALLIDLGRAGEARPLLDALALQRPDDPRVQKLLAVARQETGDDGAALRALQAAASAAPSDARTQAEFGAALARDGRYGDAAAALDVAARAHPEDALAQLRLGTALAQAGKHAEAETALRAAARLAPSEPRAWENLAVLQEERGDVPGAIEAYESMLKNVKNADPEGKVRQRIEALRALSRAPGPSSGR
ncbi:tetratricopeptide repeat protein [Myxococcota bacterium]|nr:tetratricopeptide repeat protein [Myxococcota bacterium]